MRQFKRDPALPPPGPGQPLPLPLPAIDLLVAEDDAMNRFVLSAMLEGSPVRLHFADDGARALEMLGQGGFDLALIDIRMPVLDGVALKQAHDRAVVEGRHPALPMVACSANVLAEEIETLARHGFDAHLPKPISVRALRDCIAACASIPESGATRI